ncbi:hypothetical protein [Bacillus sp. SM2101]|uniref:hypothetical protein n=1 Tax=Bacillus sp. SM2101 TaxID=2805366 RepID=UPI001BDEB528|nr:hypothetical protein [Bacillus sp. SM2101]
MKIKRYILVLLLLLVGSVLFTETALAANDLKVDVSYGFDKKVQRGRGFPVTITLSNENEKAVSGDLVIVSETNRKVGNTVIHVELAKGETKKIQTSISGLEENLVRMQTSNKESLIKFYEGSWEDNKEVELIGNKNLEPINLNESRLVLGVLSDSPDSLNFLKLTKYNGEVVEVLNIQEDELPNEELGLQVFDVLVINDFQVTSLSTQRQQAIKNWVNSGGHLIIGSVPNIATQLGEVGNLLPLQVTNEQFIDQFAFLQQYGGDDLPTLTNIPIMTGDLVDKTKVVFSDNSLPITLNKDVGSGEITQFTFNIGAESLSNWSGYANWWDDVFAKLVEKNYDKNYFHYDLSEIAEIFHSSAIPLNILILTFAIYLLVIIPVLYIILRKVDQREKAWIIIPTISILVTVSIFFVGAKDRLGSVKVNEVSILAIDEQGVGNGLGVVTFLSNNGGDYTLTSKSESYQPIPILNRYSDSIDVIENFAMVESSQGKTALTYNDVEYWSLRSATGNITNEPIGKIDVKLQVENGKLVGSLNNQLDLDLQEVYLVAGSHAYDLGNIKRGTTTDISLDIKSNNLANVVAGPTHSGALSAFPGMDIWGGEIEKNDLENWRKYRLLSTAISDRYSLAKHNQPLLVAFTNDSITDISIKDKKSVNNALNLLMQNVEIDTVGVGEFLLPEGTIIPSVSVEEGQNGRVVDNGLEYGEDWIYMEKGKYLISYQIPSSITAKDSSLSSLKISLNREASGAYSLLNNVTGESVELSGKQLFNFKENVNEFVNENGIITIKLEVSDHQDIRVPTISVEGEIK